MAIKYPGKLGKPRPFRSTMPSSSPPGFIDAWWRAETIEMEAVLADLFTFHSIEPDDWRALAWSLAKDHVPGMRRERGPRGMPKRWDGIDYGNLRAAIDEHIHKAAPRKVSIASAATYFARRDPWRTKLAGASKPADTLRKHYEAALAYKREQDRFIDSLDVEDKRQLLARLKKVLGK